MTKKSGSGVGSPTHFSEKMGQRTVPWLNFNDDDEIGHGSYGSVYRVAIDGDDYALKRIRIPEGREGREYCREIAEELLGETEMLRKVCDHPNIVTVFESEMIETETGYDIFILMELLEPFPEYQLRHEMTEPDAIHLGIDVCSALEACEQNGILHRDLKPDNILVDEAGNFKICDFGVAKNLERTFAESSVRGTFTYMAPEVYHGEKYNNRADIYSLGMILYRILNRGREPFIAAEKRQVYYKEREAALSRRMNGEALPNPADSSEELTEILMKACAYYPEKRYASAADLKADFLRLQKGEYKRKKQKAEKFGKRTTAYYRKASAIALLIIALAGILSAPLSWLYREYCVNLIDMDIKREIEETYGVELKARLNGNGVLYIGCDEDRIAIPGSSYPWKGQESNIRKIVFGENVTGVREEQNDIRIRYDTLFPQKPGSHQMTVQFENMANLEEIEIRTKKIVFPGTFSGCMKLNRITCDPEADIIGGPDRRSPWYTKDEFCMLGFTLVQFNGDSRKVDRFPENTVRIGSGAFAGLDSLEEVILPEGVREIQNGAFGECPALRHVVIPSTVEQIGENAIFRCKTLTDLELSPENTFFVYEDGVLFDKDKTTLLFCSPEIQGTFVIPDTVSTISAPVFSECKKITALVVPKTTILFRNTLAQLGPNMKDIYFGGTQEDWDYFAHDYWMDLPEGIVVHYGSDG